jgi:hypothetical protein
MADIDDYRRIVQSVLAPFAERQYAYGDIHNELVFDTVRDRYLVVSVGFDYRGVRVDACLVHIDIIDGKVWLQRDNTSDIVADQLIECGVPQSDIVLGFHPPDLRAVSGFAAV